MKAITWCRTTAEALNSTDIRRLGDLSLPYYASVYVYVREPGRTGNEARSRYSWPTLPIRF